MAACQGEGRRFEPGVPLQFPGPPAQEEEKQLQHPNHCALAQAKRHCFLRCNWRSCAAIHSAARPATHSKFTPSSGCLRSSRRSLKILSTFFHGGASRNVSNARSSFTKPFCMSEPTVSQKLARLTKCS